MKKALFILVAVTLLAGCNWVEDGEYNGDDFATVCLDGVEYWMRKSGYSGYMAVRIDPETLQPARCERRVR